MDHQKNGILYRPTRNISRWNKDEQNTIHFCGINQGICFMHVQRELSPARLSSSVYYSDYCGMGKAERCYILLSPSPQCRIIRDRSNFPAMCHRKNLQRIL